MAYRFTENDVRSFTAYDVRNFIKFHQELRQSRVKTNKILKIDTIISGFFLNHSSSIRLCLVQVAQLFFGLASTIMLLFGFYFYLADCPFGIAFDALFVPYILAVSVSYKTLWIAELSFSCENLITFQSFKFKKDISSPHVSFISYLSLYIFEVESPQCSELDNFS